MARAFCSCSSSVLFSNAVGIKLYTYTEIIQILFILLKLEPNNSQNFMISFSNMYIKWKSQLIQILQIFYLNLSDNLGKTWAKTWNNLRATSSQNYDKLRWNNQLGIKFKIILSFYYSTICNRLY